MFEVSVCVFQSFLDVKLPPFFSYFMCMCMCGVSNRSVCDMSLSDNLCTVEQTATVVLYIWCGNAEAGR